MDIHEVPKLIYFWEQKLSEYQEMIKILDSNGKALCQYNIFIEGIEKTIICLKNLLLIHELLVKRAT